MTEEIQSTTVVGCPRCGASKTSVIDSRTRNLGWIETKFRLHKCNACDYRYPTAEIPWSLAEDIFEGS